MTMFAPALLLSRQAPLWRLALCAALSYALPAFAQDASALRTASLASTCAACHGTAGHAVRGAALPGLAAMPASYLREQMLAFQRGTRPGTVMPQLAKGYSEAQVERLAAYFAAQTAEPAR